MMEIDPFSMLEVSLQEPEATDEVENGTTNSGAENIEVNVDPSELMEQDGQQGEFTSVKNEARESNGNNINAMQMVIQNGNKLAVISPEEEAYRRKLYKTMNVVLRKRLHCTICDAHIGCHLGLKNDDIEHPLLKVLSCSRCTFTYKYIDFPLTPEGKDIRCRWCTKSSSETSPLRFCKFCPFAFCEMCIYRNLPLDELARNKGTWQCFVCNMNELYPSRAILWALHAQIQFNQSRSVDDRWQGDVSQCCKGGKKKPGIEVKKSVAVKAEPEDDGQTNGHDDDDEIEIVSETPAPKPIPVAPKIYMPRRYNRTAPYNRNVSSPIIVSAHSQKIVPKVLTPITRMEKPKPLPASKYETYWLKEKILAISTTLTTLNTNLGRVSQNIPEVDDKFNIKSKMISLSSLLTIGANQINTYTKELESDWKRVLETKSYKTVNKGLRRLPITPYRRTTPLIKLEPGTQFLHGRNLSVTDRLYLQKFNIQPCYIKLRKLEKSEYEN